MTGSRRLSQAISEGDGISVLVPVESTEAARVAEEQGAEGIVVERAVAGLREATVLPVLWRSASRLEEAHAAGADACVLAVEAAADDGERLEAAHSEAQQLGLECVVSVRDEEELELALLRLDPEILLLSGATRDEGADAIDRVLELLPDVPAGKLAIADVAASTRDDVLALERAGVDAVLVGGGNVAELVGGAPPEV